jgi:outer membrane protein OmpA-like peptidoglycan-associated protein
MRYLAALLVLSLAACAPAPTRPTQPTQPTQPTKAELEAQALTQERDRAQRAQAEVRRKEAEARVPQTAKVKLPASIAARPLEPKPELEPAPAEVPQIAAVQPRAVERINPAAYAWQLSDDLRQLRAQTEVQTLYDERGWVVSLGAETLFDPGEAHLKSDAQPALDKLARLLRHYAARGILMEGPDAARAQAVKHALAERGIPAQAIASSGTGERMEFLVLR